MDIFRTVLTAILSAATLFIIAKIMGHKQIAQLDFFDYINGITIGSIAAELATELETPAKPLTAMIVYGIIAFTLSIITNKFPQTRKYINGAPLIVMDNGKLFRDNMKKAKLDLSEFMVMCRQEGYFNLEAIQTAVFEYNGRLTILPTSGQRPATPDDLNLSPEPSSVCVEVIMDGKILEKNLKRMGLDKIWLEKQLKTQGFGSAKDVYLGLCDRDKNLAVYKCE